MKRSTVYLFLATLALFSCGETTKLKRLQAGEFKAGITMSGNYESDLPELHVDKERRDTLEITDFDGEQKIIMNAVAEKDGGLVATKELRAAMITARFRNIAERHGKVDLRFDVHVPREMQDSKWQLRFDPDLYVLDDCIRLDPVIITGADYRKAQLRGYQRYQKFLDSIVTDSTKFINLRLLELYIQRYFEDIYAMKSDTTFVSEDDWQSVYGVTEREAILHYTDQIAVRRNERKKARKEEMFRKYVKAPILTEGLRLDTIIVNPEGDFIYEYVQTIETRPKMKRVDVVLSGEVCEQDQVVYRVPRTEPLSFYISSISHFVDPASRYLTKVLERSVEANSVYWIGFRQGRDEVEPGLGQNAVEIARIKENLGQLMRNGIYDIDSIAVAASTSPEGSVTLNESLSLRRARSVSSYFEQYIGSFMDSLRRAEGLSITVGEDLSEGKMQRSARADATPSIRFISHSKGENWEMLEKRVAMDSLMSEAEKDAFRKKMAIGNLDSRELALQSLASYRHLRQDIYPYLRTVQFNFYLHRRGMVKDTVHTTVLDSIYMAGVDAIKERDYKTAVTLLRPYKDYNTAVAYCAMDYNASAMEILRDLPRTEQVEYMLAILYSREGDDQNAVQHYMNAVHLNRSYIFRGNLDPEISVLIKKYGLNRDED